ncbi:uncharacterized protein GGS22DRAFT_100358 [Annulohypoxylon maeteangense]|uniref:uncharacterized protein n=1 Tax=Annulohypoxylon maeteangense TaxID=1927788 RepID=UPI00200784C0|nr:uncharacterized protein GGS22DRAFT_100358 [Annulohypoxylon maeteangense]KAI0880046.1 hypothetical protein GGS22DRAFT_100358 [Annulohypoxylon maeteangense]
MCSTYFISNSAKLCLMPAFFLILRYITSNPIILVICLFGSLIFITLSLSNNSKATALNRVRIHRSIAKFDVPGINSLVDKLTSRAIPNRRLVEAFGINNSFTTVDRGVHERFIVSAKAVILSMNQQKWSTFFAVSQAAVRQAFDILSASQQSLPLAATVRFTVFSAIIYQFFDVRLDDTNFADADEATRLINNLWEHSKNLEAAGPELRQELDRLQNALRRLLPNRYPCSSENQPLNTIIPAYETMWRVVLLTYVSVGFRDVGQEITQQFQKVSQDVHEYCATEGNRILSDMSINFAKEGLRLYPPTKRIHRNIPDGRNGPFNVKADIEWCHREKQIWGLDAEQFRPSRFQDWTADMKDAYMPFGAGLNQCPTARTFSYHAIVILVTALAKRLGTREYGSRVVFNDSRFDMDPTELLPSGRMDMEDWVLQMDGTEWLGRAM